MNENVGPTFRFNLDGNFRSRGNLQLTDSFQKEPRKTGIVRHTKAN
jgi:hypothetical protein